MNMKHWHWRCWLLTARTSFTFRWEYHCAKSKLLFLLCILSLIDVLTDCCIPEKHCANVLARVSASMLAILFTSFPFPVGTRFMRVLISGPGCIFMRGPWLLTSFPWPDCIFVRMPWLEVKELFSLFAAAGVVYWSCKIWFSAAACTSSPITWGELTHRSLLSAYSCFRTDFDHVFGKFIPSFCSSSLNFADIQFSGFFMAQEVCGEIALFSFLEYGCCLFFRVRLWCETILNSYI